MNFVIILKLVVLIVVIVEKNNYDLNCDPCTCENGLCYSGQSGKGVCLDCYNQYYGENCENTCQCYKGICKDGILGDGTCLICFTNYFGDLCDQFCYCDKGDCDYVTGVCLSCFDDYFGTNCYVPKLSNQFIFPIVNCIEKDILNNTFIYLGYANTKPFGNFSYQTIGDNTFKCGNNTIILPISYFVYGQFNFIIKIECNDNIIWSINGSVLTLSIDELNSKLCSNVDYQKVVLTALQTPSFSSAQLDNLKQNFVTVLNISSSRVNITQRPNDENINTDGDIVVSVLKGNGTEPEHSSIIYNFTSMISQNTSTISEFITNTNLSQASLKLTTLTFNETVGTNQGCFKTDPQTLLVNLYVNPNIDCSPKTSSPLSETNNPSDYVTTTIIIVGIGVATTLIIVIVIILVVPVIKNSIFPNAKNRQEKIEVNN